jgi:SAM-dependent methyltransferase
VHRPEDDWEELARREPHFAVLTNEEFLRERLTPEALERFWKGGEDDVAMLLRFVDFQPELAVDFGCGVGRLTRALAKRAKHVIGVDVSPTMLALAPKLPNVNYTDRLPESADFIGSLIVFQHIPVNRGYEIFRQLLQILKPGGVAAIHFALSRPGGPLRRIARRIRAASPLIHRLLPRPHGLPYMQINTYNRDKLISIIDDEGCMEPRFVDYDQGEVKGAIVLTSRA